MCIGYSNGQTVVCVLNIALVKRLYVYIEYSFGQTVVWI